MLYNTITLFKSLKTQAGVEKFTEDEKVQVNITPQEFSTPSKKDLPRKVSFILYLILKYIKK